MRRTPFIPFVSSLAASLVVFAGAIPAAAVTVVHTCGQETTGPATLADDLDCTGFDGNALTMHGGTLTMNGHTITGGFIGVSCDKSCKIVGPGTVTASTFAGVNALEAGLKMTQVDVTDCGVFGAQVWDTATISGPATFSGHGTAIRVGVRAKLKDLTITGNHTGVEAANNADVGSILVQGSTISGNEAYGLLAQRAIKMKDSTVADNGRTGVLSGLVCDKKSGATLVRSTVTGNGTAPECGSGPVCADVATCNKRPRVKTGSTCGTSYQIGSGNPGSNWDVCTLD